MFNSSCASATIQKQLVNHQTPIYSFHQGKALQVIVVFGLQFIALFTLLWLTTSSCSLHKCKPSQYLGKSVTK